jgi:hypothetical protein
MPAPFIADGEDDITNEPLAPVCADPELNPIAPLEPTEFADAIMDDPLVFGPAPEIISTEPPMLPPTPPSMDTEPPAAFADPPADMTTSDPDCPAELSA